MQATQTKFKKLLLVDDNEDHLFLEKTLFEQTIPDISVEAATSGQECLDRIREGDFACIVSDYNMGSGVNGLQLLQRLRDMDVNIPFFIVSSDDCPRLRLEAFKRGAKGCISKSEQYNNFKIVADLIVRIIDEHLKKGIT